MAQQSLYRVEVGTVAPHSGRSRVAKQVGKQLGMQLANGSAGDLATGLGLHLRPVEPYGKVVRAVARGEDAEVAHPGPGEVKGVRVAWLRQDVHFLRGIALPVLDELHALLAVLLQLLLLEQLVEPVVR